MSGLFEIKSIKHLLLTADMDRAIAFYRTVFDLQVKVSTPYWSELIYGDSLIAFHGGSDGQIHQSWLSFTVSDIHAACQAIISAGGTIKEPPEDRGDEGIILAQFVDLDGNIVMLSQDKL